MWVVRGRGPKGKIGIFFKTFSTYGLNKQYCIWEYVDVERRETKRKVRQKRPHCFVPSFWEFSSLVTMEALRMVPSRLLLGYDESFPADMTS